MEEVCERENLREAWRRVKANQGSAGVDGITIVGLTDYLKQHGPAIREQVLNGTYEPKPVRRVEIPKPDGGVRKLGIPTVLDRLIQQAVMQVLQRRWDRTFSDHSYGFRPGRSAHQAVAQAQQYIAEGYGWCVDFDLEKFFDRVNHDKLMGQIAKRVEDKRLLKLIRAFLKAGVMENGLVSPSVEGTPQGGPLSPLLSNLVLDELDRELERRGHRFVRYADDYNIYVRSDRAPDRLDRYPSMEEYAEAKFRIFANQKTKDFFIGNADDEYCAWLRSGAGRSIPARALWFGIEPTDRGLSMTMLGDAIVLRDKRREVPVVHAHDLDSRETQCRQCHGGSAGCFERWGQARIRAPRLIDLRAAPAQAHPCASRFSGSRGLTTARPPTLRQRPRLSRPWKRQSSSSQGARARRPISQRLPGPRLAKPNGLFSSAKPRKKLASLSKDRRSAMHAICKLR